MENDSLILCSVINVKFYPILKMFIPVHIGQRKDHSNITLQYISESLKSWYHFGDLGVDQYNGRVCKNVKGIQLA
jgi:hypothetical protein